MVVALFVAAQIERRVVTFCFDEAEQLNIEVTRPVEIGDAEFAVRRADDVRAACHCWTPWPDRHRGSFRLSLRALVPRRRCPRSTQRGKVARAALHRTTDRVPALHRVVRATGNSVSG